MTCRPLLLKLNGSRGGRN